MIHFMIKKKHNVLNIINELFFDFPCKNTWHGSDYGTKLVKGLGNFWDGPHHESSYYYVHKIGAI